MSSLNRQKRTVVCRDGRPPLTGTATIALAVSLLMSQFAIAAKLDDDSMTDNSAASVTVPAESDSEEIGEKDTAGVELADIDVVDSEVSDGGESFEIAFVGPPVPADGDVAESEVSKPKPPVAANIDLSQPVAPVPDIGGIDIGMIAPPVEPVLAVYAQPSLLMLGAEVAAGTSTRLAWSPAQSFAGIAAPTPVLVVNGAKQGPTLCVIAAIHGDELNGIETVRRVLYDLDPEKLSGAVIGVPIVNLQGFRRASRYLPDRRDLNRYFPGNPSGSSASRLAHSFFTEVVSKCSAVVDLHTGSFQRTNLPQLRADLKNPQVVELTQGFGSTVVLHSAGASGTLRRAASDAGIPTVTLEAGEPARVQISAVSHSTKGVMTLLNQLAMYEKVTKWGSSEPVYYRSTWIRANQGGVLFSKVELGDRVRQDQLLGTVTDPITNVQTELRASTNGRVLGMALDQFVMPGFAAFRIGIEAPEEDVTTPSAIDLPASTVGMENADNGSESTTLAESAVEPLAEFDGFEEFEGDEMLDARDNLEDSE